MSPPDAEQRPPQGPPSRNTTTGDGTRSCCRGTGYTTDGYLFEPGPCTCDARPFEPASPERDAVEQAPIPEFTKAEAVVVDVATEANVADLTVCIDNVLRWSRSTIGQLVATAQWLSYLEAGGLAGVAGRHVLQQCDDLELAAGELPPLLDQLRAAASRTVEEAWA